MIVEFEETSTELAAQGIALEKLEDQEAPKKWEPWPLLSLPVPTSLHGGEDASVSRRSIRGHRIGPLLPLDLGDKDAKVSHLNFYVHLKATDSIPIVFVWQHLLLREQARRTHSCLLLSGRPHSQRPTRNHGR